VLQVIATVLFVTDEQFRHAEL